MTRFARARGSKSSNKREPEEATSWSQLKQGLVNRSETNATDTKAQEIQKCKDTVRALQKEDEKCTTWAAFDEDVENKNKRSSNEIKKENAGKKRKNISQGNTNDEAVKSKKQKRGKIKSNPEEIYGENTSNEISPVKKNTDANPKRTNANATERKSLNESIKDSEENKESKKKKRKSFKTDKSKIPQDTDPTKPSGEIGSIKNEVKEDQMKNSFPKNKKRKNEPSRRKPLPAPYQMDLNGKMVDVVTYDGFPIMLEDANRLEELKKSLYAKGISNGEIKKIIKLQRRNAEKALTRARKKVCFNCRKSGHPLSECPSLNQGEGTGICFKCGSTEHTHYECRVVKKQDYKFAQCFICKEQGHISNQCPDNPRGLYPKGGACKLCGDVTHLKRFCPTLAKESEPTIDDYLGEESSKQKRFPATNKYISNKIVRF